MAVTLPLSACLTTAEQMAANDDAACRGAGLKPGTPAYAKCRRDRTSRANMQQMITIMNQADQFRMMRRQSMMTMQH